ncbi:mitotic-spindle organizing protein 2B [Biomphalaria glabrata]|nr:mitotic-spindle organizing protein 2B [Biomphalaria glabrata]
MIICSYSQKMSKLQKEVIHAQLVSKAVLSPDENELYLLSQHAAIHMDPQVFKIILDLLKFNVPPLAIVDTLKSMCTQHQTSTSGFLGSGEPHHSLRLSNIGSQDSSTNQLAASRSVSERSVRGNGSLHKSFTGEYLSHSSTDDVLNYSSGNVSKDSSYGHHVDRPGLHHITVRQRGSVDDHRADKYRDRVNKKR